MGSSEKSVKDPAVYEKKKNLKYVSFESQSKKRIEHKQKWNNTAWEFSNISRDFTLYFKKPDRPQKNYSENHLNGP